MTHDELLARLDGQIESSKVIGCKCPACDNAVALCAVVELHKSEWVLLQIVLRGTKPDPVAICSHCSDDQWRKSYPCPTIQAIEKELK